MNSLKVFVLTKLSLDGRGDVVSRNVGVTFSFHEAEAHRADGVEHDYESFQIESKWEEDAATSELVIAMRAFRDYVEELRAEALR